MRRCIGIEEAPLVLNTVSIKVQKTTKLNSLIQEISKVSQIPEHLIMLAEISHSKILRRITSDPKTNVSKLRFLPGAELFAYEVHSAPEQLKLAYPIKIKVPNYEPGEFVDIYDADAKEWRIGKIHHKSADKAPQLTVLIEAPGKPSKEIRTVEFSKEIAPFMSNTVNFNEIEILPLYQRYSNKPDEALTYMGLPKLIAIGSWATCGQIVNEVISQVKYFIQSDQTSHTGSQKIMPPMGIAWSATKHSKVHPPITKTPSISHSKAPSQFKVTMIDTSTDTCAICSSRIFSGNKFLYSTKTKQCRGCNLLDYADTPIKFIVNYFGCVAICVDWKNPQDYIAPKIRSEAPSRKGSDIGKNKPTLEECLKLFTAKEKISDYKCEKCNKTSAAEMQVLISKLPDILIIHFKRFMFMDDYIEKLAVHVNFPLRKLNMSPWIIPSLGGSYSSSFATKGPVNEYDLYAIANHHSMTASGGHYTAFIESEEAGQDKSVWVECDDTALRGIAGKDVVTSEAYLLFYKRRVMSASNIVNLTYLDQNFT